MSIKAENRSHFGVPIFESLIPTSPRELEDIKNQLLRLRDSDKEGISRSNQRGWHSDDNLHQSDSPVLQWLTEQVFQIGCQMIRHAERLPSESPVYLSSLWANINDFGAWNAPHAHLPCEWSGCVYIDVNETPQERNNGIAPGDIMFFDPIPVGAPYRPAATVNYTPKNGTMFLFPGYLLHMVAPHYDEKPRISVAFNFRLGENIQQVAR
ncbi:TIGR02466 family protein [Aliikangiella sp. G2MR2-5]|uniref:TIGR02466 family protein n=1 Tax=Aliikangiella sp. G2MR2-5 TaxID=2788943 RepID=UPI0018A9F5DD|nr:TIGR02466 family protein [Aliikangiella sp. G2MR2-5]